MKGGGGGGREKAKQSAENKQKRIFLSFLFSFHVAGARASGSGAVSGSTGAGAATASSFVALLLSLVFAASVSFSLSVFCSAAMAGGASEGFSSVFAAGGVLDLDLERPWLDRGGSLSRDRDRCGDEPLAGLRLLDLKRKLCKRIFVRI